MTIGKGQLDDYRRVGPDKRAIYLETDPYGMPSLREHVQNTRHAGLIHRCGKRRRGLRLRMDIWISRNGGHHRGPSRSG